MKNINKQISVIIVLIVFLFIASAASLFADNIAMSGLLMPSTRNAGRGGDHVAYTDDMYSLFVNPAALMNANQSSVLSINPALMLKSDLGDTIGVISKVIDGDFDDIIKDLGEFASKTEGKFPIGLDLRGPISFAHTRNGFGWGLFSRENVDVRVNGTDVDALINLDGIFNLGFAFSILKTDRQSIDAGFAAKAFGRVLVDESLDALDMVLDSSAVLDKIEYPFIFGGGLDLGIMYRTFFKNISILQFGLVFDDVFTRGISDNGNTYYVPFTINSGISYTINLGIIKLAAMADIHDIGSFFDYNDFTKRNPILGVSFGLDATLFNFIHANVGLKEWLPSVGAALTLGSFELSASYYGKELGNEPGSYSVYVLDISLAIRWNTKPIVRGYNNIPLLDRIFRPKNNDADNNNAENDDTK